MKKHVAYITALVVSIVLLIILAPLIKEMVTKPKSAYIKPHSSEVHLGYDNRVPHEVEWVQSPNDPNVELPYVKDTDQLLVGHRKLPYKNWNSDYGHNFDDAHPKCALILKPGHPALPSEYQRACEDDVDISVKARVLRSSIEPDPKLVSPLTSSEGQ